MVSMRVASALLAAMVAAGLSGCGGGDDDGDVGGGGGPPTPDDADAAGLYEGSMLLDGTSRNFVVAVAADGTFAGGFAAAPGGTNARTLYGNGVANGSAFTATGTAYAPSGAPFTAGGTTAPLTISNGIIDEGVRLQGSYTAGGESGNFTVNYRQEISARGAQLSRIAGTYTTFPAPSAGGLSLTLTIDTMGAFTLSGGGCTATGNVSIQDPDVNVYSVTLNAAACLSGGTYSGLMSLEDSSPGMNNRPVMFVVTPSQGMSFAFAGLRQ
jgi:hypothetical protein